MSRDSELVEPSSEDENDESDRISALANLEHDASPVFLSRIRSTIRRRAATSQLAAVYWALPPVVAGEFGRMLVALLNSLTVKKEKKP